MDLRLNLNIRIVHVPEDTFTVDRRNEVVSHFANIGINPRKWYTHVLKKGQELLSELFC